MQVPPPFDAVREKRTTLRKAKVQAREGATNFPFFEISFVRLYGHYRIVKNKTLIRPVNQVVKDFVFIGNENTKTLRTTTGSLGL